MRRALCIPLLLSLCAAAPPPLAHAQFAQKDPLNDKEVDEVRESGNQPNERIKLYLKYIEQRISSIRELLAQKHPDENRPAELRDKLEEFTRLVDELQDNLDTYARQKADVRKALKDLVPASVKWNETLNKPPADATYDFPRKTALDAAQSLSDSARQMQQEQEKYFAEHKDERNKNGAGPQD